MAKIKRNPVAEKIADLFVVKPFLLLLVDFGSGI